MRKIAWFNGTLLAADVRFGSKADICSALAHVRFIPESGHVLAKRFNELSKLDGFLRPGAVPIISVPLAFWCASRSLPPSAFHSPLGAAWKQ
jgi:hypothetical protein